jgi:hypothetical protein
MGGPVGVVMARFTRLTGESAKRLSGLKRTAPQAEAFEKRSRSADLVEEFWKLRDFLCVTAPIVLVTIRPWCRNAQQP